MELCSMTSEKWGSPIRYPLLHPLLIHTIKKQQTSELLHTNLLGNIPYYFTLYFLQHISVEIKILCKIMCIYCLIHLLTWLY